MKVILIFLVTLTLVSCGNTDEKTEVKESGVIGFECTAAPIIFNSKGWNLCQGIYKQFYPGLVSILGKSDVITRCKSANALDYAAEVGQSCYNECEKVAYCVGPVSN